jgi:hypothetical protein
MDRTFHILNRCGERNETFQIEVDLSRKLIENAVNP